MIKDEISNDNERRMLKTYHDNGSDDQIWIDYVFWFFQIFIKTKFSLSFFRDGFRFIHQSNNSTNNKNFKQYF